MKKEKKHCFKSYLRIKYLAPNGDKGKENTMGIMNILGGIMEAAVEMNINSYTEEEKQKIKEVRDLMYRKGKNEAVKALDEVIKDFCLGVTKRPSTTTTPISSGQVMSTAEFVYELKNKLKTFYGNLDPVIVYDDNTITIGLRLVTSPIVTYTIQNGRYQGMSKKRSTYLYEKEIAACEADIVRACREIRNL